MTPIDTIIANIAAYTKTCSALHGDFLQHVRRDIERFKEMTQSLHDQKQWQGWTTIGLSAFNGSLAIAGACIPKTGVDATANQTRLNANDGPSDAFSNAIKAITDKLKDNEFLRTTCKTSAKFIHNITPAVDSFYGAKQTDMEAKRQLFQLGFQEAGQEKTRCDQASRQAQETALSILQSKAKGG
jgi:predicted secreted protein